ncbi:hypothetical protein BHM03_00017417 [Ensete ventricosum]|nr:hypothetical protein BHM03_00017417 [Ensete ventricosum]
MRGEVSFSSPRVDEKLPRLLLARVKRSRRCFPLSLIASDEKAMMRRPWGKSRRFVRFSSSTALSRGSLATDVSDNRAAVSSLEGGTV